MLRHLLAACLITSSAASLQSQANREPIASPRSRRTLPRTSFYDTPVPLPANTPGALIRSQEFEGYTLPEGVQAVRILYHSRSAFGNDVASSGVVLYPDAKAPAGGWPVLAWAHALNGVSRLCAPSLARNLQHGPFLAMYVRLGYAVVATDYAGLGTSFRSAFSDVPSNAADVIFSIPAARTAVPQLSSRWIAIGIAQGGSAVVGVAELEREMHDSNYLGAIAISGLEDSADFYDQPRASGPSETPLSLAYGIRTIYPAIELNDILTDPAMALYAQVDQDCGEPLAASKPSPVMLKPGWAQNKFVKLYFARSSLGQKPAQGPLLVLSSELDPANPTQRTAGIVARMCAQGDQVEFDRYPQTEPGNIFGDSVSDQIAWIQGRFSGRPAAGNCSGKRDRSAR